MGQIKLHTSKANTQLRIVPPDRIEPDRLYQIVQKDGTQGPFGVTRSQNGALELKTGVPPAAIEKLVEMPPLLRVSSSGGAEIHTPTVLQAFEFMDEHFAEDVTLHV